MLEQDIRRLLGLVGIQFVRKTYSGWLEAPCPLAPWTHARGADRNPSFGVKEDATGMSGFKCQACHRKGTVPSLIRTLANFREEDYSDLELEAERTEMLGVVNLPDWEDRFAFKPEPEPLNTNLYYSMYPDVCLPEYTDAHYYLQSRGITQEAAALMQLRYDPDENRVLFPVFSPKPEDAESDGWDLYGFTGRAIFPSIKPKIKNYAGLDKRSFILGEHLIRATGRPQPLLVVEGLFAYAHLQTLQLHEEDYFDVVAIMGSDMSDEQVERLVSYDVPIYLLFDNDEAGDVGLFGIHDDDLEKPGAIEKLINYVPLFVPEWPEGKDDPDQLTLEEVKAFLDEEPFIA